MQIDQITKVFSTTTNKNASCLLPFPPPLPIPPPSCPLLPASPSSSSSPFSPFFHPAYLNAGRFCFSSEMFLGFDTKQMIPWKTQTEGENNISEWNIGILGFLSYPVLCSKHARVKLACPHPCPP